MVNNVINVKTLDHFINLINEYVASNLFAFSKGLIDNITCNSDFVTFIIIKFFIA